MVVTTILMTTKRDDHGISYAVWVEYDSEDCFDKTMVWEKRLEFQGDRRDGPRARIIAREQEKVAVEQQRKLSGAWKWSDRLSPGSSTNG